MKDDAAALLLYRSQRAALVDYARSITGNPAHAEDVVQEAWLHFDRAETVVREPLGYLYRIVRNLAIDGLRRAAREQQSLHQDIDAAAQAVPDETPSAETMLIAREEVRIVADTIAALPERQRIAIEMYRLGGFKLREIAERLNVSIPLVHRLIADGLAECDRRRSEGAQW